MKYSPIVLLLLFVAPLVLAACGDGGPTGNAERFLEAVNQRDAIIAKEYACEALHESIDFLITSETSGNLDQVTCEEGDGNEVNCTIIIGDTENQVTLVMDENDKVCGGDLFRSDQPGEIPDVPDAPEPEATEDPDAEAPPQ